MYPFENLVILDLTHVLAGPYATYQFALLGADVIKVENPANPDCARGRGPSAPMAENGLGINYQVQAANKRAIALNLKTEQGKMAFLRLVDRADILVENYSPGSMEAMGLGAEALMQRNERLIYCSINGFDGDGGGQSTRNAYDNVIQAASGIMASTGTAEAPIKTAASIIDYFTGMSAAFAISAALHQRVLTNKGQHVRCAMFDCALALMAPEVAAHLFDGPSRSTPPEAGLGAYDTANGQLMLGAFTPDQYSVLWRTLDVPEFSEIKSWEDVWAHSAAMRIRLTEIFAAKSASDWEAELNAVGIPAQRIRTLDEALHDPTLARPHFLKPVQTPAGEVMVPLNPYMLGEYGPTINSPPPRLGEHSDTILRESGFSEDEILSLRSNGAVT